MYYQYTILCTEEQITKALKLGAPIDFRNGDGPYISIPYYDKDNRLFYHNYAMPTAEQMIGWLEEQGLFIHIDYDFKDKSNPYKCEMILMNGLTRHCGWFVSRKEATLAAIDAVLKYLSKK